MKQLAEVSPPDIATMDWERRIHHFMSGQTALAYCWTMRAARFEHELSSRVARRVAYLRTAHPLSGDVDRRHHAGCDASRRQSAASS